MRLRAVEDSGSRDCVKGCRNVQENEDIDVAESAAMSRSSVIGCSDNCCQER